MLLEQPDREKRIKDFIITVLIASLVIVLAVLFKTGCPLDVVFGIPCPMCGITRAILSLLHGDIYSAFYYHPLWPVIIASVILFSLYTLGIIRPSKKVFTIACFFLGFLLLGCWIIRHIQGSPIVRFHFGTSLIYRVLQFFS